jgi:soluble lytic murein transglycosylase-like protein
MDNAVVRWAVRRLVWAAAGVLASLVGPALMVALALGLPLLVLVVVFAPFAGPAPPAAAARHAVQVTYRADEMRAVAAACPAGTSTCVTLPFVQAVMLAESGGNPHAVSQAHPPALGLMQVEPYHFPPGANPFDPWTNILTGVRILDADSARYAGNLPLVAAAYNAGPGAVAAWERATGSTAWPVLAAYIRATPALAGYRQTVRYVATVMGYYTTFTSAPTPTAHGGRP